MHSLCKQIRLKVKPLHAKYHLYLCDSMPYKFPFALSRILRWITYVCACILHRDRQLTSIWLASILSLRFFFIFFQQQKLSALILFVWKTECFKKRSFLLYLSKCMWKEQSKHIWYTKTKHQDNYCLSFEIFPQLYLSFIWFYSNSNGFCSELGFPLMCESRLVQRRMRIVESNSNFYCVMNF